MKKIILAVALLIGVFSSNNINAQGFFSRFKNGGLKETIQSVAGDVASDYINFSIVGDWTYNGAAIKFESSDKLKDIAASAASETIEDKITEQLEKIGIKAGMMHFKFNEDHTMAITLGTRNIKGTYNYDKETKVLEMKIARAIPVKSTVLVTNSEFSLLFKANGLITLVKSISGKLKIESLESACKLLDNYEEMRLGFEFKKG